MSQLISSWLTNYNNDYLKFLKAVRMSSTENQLEKTKEIVKYVLNSLFRLVNFLYLSYTIFQLNIKINLVADHVKKL